MRLTVRFPTQVTVVSALFAAGMWMSKIAQPLHFEARGDLVAFGVGYAVMALVGSLSFVWGHVADLVGGLRAMQVGLVLYAVGIAGRVVTDLPAVVVFSALAGAGASTVLVAIRPWVRRRAAEADIARVVASRNLGNQLGLFAGSAAAAALFAVPDDAARGPLLALWAAPALVLLALVWLVVVADADVPVAVVRHQVTEPPVSDRRALAGLSARLAVIGVLSGFYVSLLTPYAPLILTEVGGSAAKASLVVGASSAAQLVVSAALTRYRRLLSRPLVAFTAAETVAAAVTVLLAFALDLGLAAVALVFVVRAALVSVAAICEETVQYAVIPAASSGLVFGVSQTAFLAGDSLGGVLGAPLWLARGSQGLLLVSGAVMLLNALLVPLLLRDRLGTAQRETVAAASEQTHPVGVTVAEPPTPGPGAR